MRAVPRSPELARILALARRKSGGVDDLIDPLSELLRKPGHVCRPPGTRGPDDKGCADGFTRLNRLQAQALSELHDFNGLWLQGPLGAGKTGITVLGPRLLNRDRALLVTPGGKGFREKTIHDIDIMKEHWDILPFQLESYQKLSLESAENFFYEYPGPYNLIMLDESQACKSEDAAVRRRIDRLVANSGKLITLEHFVTKQKFQVQVPPKPPFASLTATPSKESILDVTSTMFWCLGDRSPLPRPSAKSDIQDWAACLDPRPAERLLPGALTAFSGGKDSLEDVRKGVGDWIFDTPGCISSSETFCNAKLSITLRNVTLSKEEDHWFKVLRGDPDDPENFPGKTTPDGDVFTDSMEMWRHACSLALGFYTIWDPPAPPEWRLARYLWHTGVNDILRESDTLDTIKQVASAIDNGRFKHLKEILDQWREIEPTFTPNSVPVWVGDSALRYATEWLRGGGIVWTAHVPFGEELSRRAGVPYFGEEGLSAAGESIVHTRAPGLVASVIANGKGHNLQHYNRSLVASIWPVGYAAEQMLGRSHRQNQKRDVTVDWMISCREQLNGFDRAQGLHGPYYRDLFKIPSRMIGADLAAEKIDTRGWAFREQEE